jgi:hypothetical protein
MDSSAWFLPCRHIQTGTRGDAAAAAEGVISCSFVLDAVKQDEKDALKDGKDALEEVLDSDEDGKGVVEEVPDFVEEVPDSVDKDGKGVVEEVPDFIDEVLESVDEVPDVDEVVECPRCCTFHAGGVFGEACKQARRNARRCARCGLLHEDYDFFAQVLDGMEKFDCEFYIPDVEKLQMNGDTIILPDEVVEKLDEMEEKKKQAKNNTKN